MALIVCPECNREISSLAASCPHCGYPIAETNQSTPKDTEHSVHSETSTQPVQDSVISGSYVVDSKQTKNSSKKSSGCLGVFLKLLGMVIVLTLLLSFCGTDSEETKESALDKNNAQSQTESIKESDEKEEVITEAETVQATEDTSASDSQDSQTDDSVIDNALQKFNKGNYKYITAKSLATYSANLKGEKVYLVSEVTNVSENSVSVKLADTSGSVSTKADYSDLLKDGDKVAIYGKVDDDFSLLGLRMVNLKNGGVFAIGKEAKSYKKKESDASLQDKLKMTADVIDSLGSDNVSEKDYKKLCQDLSYKKILRTPSKYEGELCYVSGRVNQIIEGWLSDTLYIVDEYGNKWTCSYHFDDDEVRVLEGDHITVYGECQGTSKSKTVLGKQVTMPYVKVTYID